MSLTDFEIVMYQLWRQSKGSIDQYTTDITLAGFEGYCYQCKQQGHKADACPNGSNSKSSSSGGRTSNSAGQGRRGGRGSGQGGT
jgi:hypothetical protein